MKHIAAFLCTVLIGAGTLFAEYPPSGALHNISEDFQSTFSSFALVERDIQGTYTILGSVSTDFTGVFTALDACCNTLQQDFAYTWTILDNLTVNADNSGVYTALQNLEQDFAYTWTILDGLKVTTDISGIFTELATLEQDFAYTWTMLNKIESDVVVIQSVVNEDFAFTWTILRAYPKIN